MPGPNSSKGRKTPTRVWEAAVDGELWIWHALFGSTASLNDIDVLEHSTKMEKISADLFPPSCDYKVIGRYRKFFYYLADGIYPNWVLFAKMTKEPSTEMKKEYAWQQEAVWKDVERAFGVLVAGSNILKNPARL